MPETLAESAWEWWRRHEYGFADMAGGGSPEVWAFYWRCEPAVMRTLRALPWVERRRLAWLLPDALALAALR